MNRDKTRRDGEGLRTGALTDIFARSAVWVFANHHNSRLDNPFLMSLSVCIRGFHRLVFISVYQCSSVDAIVFVSRQTECYIYPRHAGVNSGICTVVKLGRWLLLTALLLMATTSRTQKTPRTTAAPIRTNLSSEG